MTAIPGNVKRDIDNIIVIMIDDDVYIDPVSLSIIKDRVIKEISETKDPKIAFILERKSSDATNSYHYLRIKKGDVSEHYLFSPMQFNHFKKKKLCSELWHGCKEPTLEQIKQHAKILRYQEKK